MQKNPRDLGGPIAIVNRFTVKEDADSFEREFLRHAGLFGSDADVDFIATFRLVERPEIYMHFGFWHTLAAFIEAVHDESFLQQVERIGTMVDTQADQAVSVHRVVGGETCELTATTRVVLTRLRVGGNFRAFERNLRERGEFLTAHSGASGAQILRSVVSPRNYVGLEWARDAELFERARAHERYRQLTSLISDVAEMEVEDSRCVAGWRGPQRLDALKDPALSPDDAVTHLRAR